MLVDPADRRIARQLPVDHLSGVGLGKEVHVDAIPGAVPAEAGVPLPQRLAAPWARGRVRPSPRRCTPNLLDRAAAVVRVVADGWSSAPRCAQC